MRAPDVDLGRRRDRALARSVWSGGAARIISLLLAMATVSLSVRSLGPSAYGAVAVLGAIVGVAGFADLGLGQGLMSKLAQIVDGDVERQRTTIVSSAAFVLIPLGFLTATIGLLSMLVVPWGTLLGAPDVPPGAISVSVAIFAVSTGLSIPAGIGQRVLLGLQKGTTANLWALTATGVQFIAVLLCAAIDAPIYGFVLATLSVPVLVACGQSWWVTGHDLRDRPSIKQVSRPAIRDLASLGGLFFVLNVAVAFAYQSDTVIVSAVLGASAAAVFAVSARMFSSVSGLVSTSLQQLWPALAEALTVGDLPWVRKRFWQILVVSTGLLAIACCALVLCGQALTAWWVGPDVVPTTGLLIAFATWTVYSCAMSQCSVLLNAASVVRPQVIMAIAMTAANVVLSIALTQRIGLAGPLIGSLVAHVICSGVPTLFFVRRVLRGTP